MYQKPQSYEVWFLRYGVGPFFPFYTLITHKSKILKNNEKIIWRCHNFTHAKNHNHMMYSSGDMECDRHNFLSFQAIFCLLPHYRPWKLNFGKNIKKAWRYYPFTHVYHKWRSYDVWFLRYEVRQTEIFVILDHFLLFYPTNNSKTQNF